MNFRVVKGWTLAVVSGLVFVAATILIATNMTDQIEVRFWGTVIATVHTGTVMLVSAAGGIVLVVFAMVLRIGVKSIRTGRKIQAAQVKPEGTPGGDTPNA